MCAKDEEREPLQPDGNNKDVKVTIIAITKITTTTISQKVKVKV